MNIDKTMKLMENLHPLHRTLNHKDNQKALMYIKEAINKNDSFKIHSYDANSNVWTWKIPKRFHVNYAYLKDMEGNIIINYDNHPLSIVSYSISINKKIHFKELQNHLHFSEDNPTEIPWVYKYYNKDWGLSLSKNTFEKLNKDAYYEIDINTEFLDEAMILGEYFIKGNSTDEILIVTDICHPYQVNDSISGVVIATELINNIIKKKIPLQQSMRFLFVPETIGSISWLAYNESKIKNIIMGLTFDCLATKGTLKIQKTLYGTSYIDFIAIQEFQDIEIAEYVQYMSNDELVMSSPNVEIPTVSFTRAPYKEYHTSGDNMSIVDKKSLQESYNSIEKLINIISRDYIPKQLAKGTIFMSKYDLWVDEKENYDLLLKQHMILQYINGKHSVYEISNLVKMNFEHLLVFLEKLFEFHLIEKFPIKSCFNKEYNL